MANLWTALIADKLGPGGNETGWDETPVRIRNRFIRAVRPVLGSGAAFQASLSEFDPAAKAASPSAPKAAARPAKKASGKRHDPRELHLPLMTSVSPREHTAREKSGKTSTAAKKPRR
jgi:hypothetical protein